MRRVVLVELSSAVLIAINECCILQIFDVIGIDPYALSIKTPFETLYTDDSKQQPEESNKKGNIE